MATKCLNCGKGFEGRAKYCSARCKQAAYRNRTEASTVTNPTVTTVTEPTVTDESPVDSVTPEVVPSTGGLLETLEAVAAGIKLPACVPKPVVSRYVRGEPEYIKTIDRLISHTLTELEAMGIWTPCWRHFAGERIQ